MLYTIGFMVLLLSVITAIMVSSSLCCYGGCPGYRGKDVASSDMLTWRSRLAADHRLVRRRPVRHCAVTASPGQVLATRPGRSPQAPRSIRPERVVETHGSVHRCSHSTFLIARRSSSPSVRNSCRAICLYSPLGSTCACTSAL